LTSSSDVFAKVFGIGHPKVDDIDINNGAIQGIHHIYIEAKADHASAGCKQSTETTKEKKEEANDNTVVITISQDIHYKTFKRVLEFIYSGSVSIKDASYDIEDTVRVAKLFNIDYLVTYCDNILEGKTCNHRLCLSTDRF